MKTDNPQTHARTITLLLLIILLGALLLSTAGCRTIHDTQTIIRTDTLRIAARERIILRTDTVHITDRATRNDTVFLRDSIRIRLYRDSIIHDTITAKSHNTQTVVQTREVVRRSPYDRFCSIALWVLLLIAIIAIVIKILAKRLTPH